jgi:hypothetical protein
MINVTSSDAIKIDGRLITGFADEDNAKITFPNDLSNQSTGKDGNAIIAYMPKGLNGELEMRLLSGCADDKFLNARLTSYNNNPATFALMTLEFDKIIGDGSGDAVTTIVYLGQGGSFKKQPEVLENQSGETKQAVTIWNLKFISITRSIE